MSDDPCFILGVDPGLHGAFALYNDAGLPIHFYDMPLLSSGTLDIQGVAKLVRSIKAKMTDASIPLVAAVEQVTSRPRQNGQFSFGLYTGVLHGVLAANDIPFKLISPMMWKGAMGLRAQDGDTKREAKDRSRLKAIEAFPELASQLNLKKHDGRAEALLIAVYAAGLPVMRQRTAQSRRKK